MTVELAGIGYRVGGLQVLDGIDLAVPSGGVTGLIGPNGAGKSTLFAIIGGTLHPEAGTVRYEGQELEPGRPATRPEVGLGRTFQVPRPFRHLTVRENLAAAAPDQPGETLFGALLGGRRVRERESEIQAKAEEIIAFLALARVADLPAGQLSGGQRKLLELGRVLMTDPSTILLDEPFAGVNPVLVAEIGQHILALNGRGIGFFIVEHNIQALAKLVTEMHVLDRGRLLASGAPDHVLARSDVQLAYMGAGA